MAIIERTFIVEEHGEQGFCGFRPVDCPDADPLGGLGLAHDCLEHPDADGTGGVGDEFQAIGATAWLRADSGYWAHEHGRRSLIGPTRPAAETLCGEFGDVLGHVIDEGFHFEPNEAPPVGDIGEALISATIEAAGELFASEYDVDEEIHALWADPSTVAAVRGNMRQGWAWARERYPDAASVAHGVFSPLEREADKALAYANEGDRFAVRIDSETLEYSLTPLAFCWNCEAPIGGGEEFCGDCAADCE